MPTRTRAVLLATVLTSACGVNNIPTYDEAVNTIWAEIQSQYLLRAELTAELIKIVEDIGHQDPELLRDLTEARIRVTTMTVTPDLLTDPETFEQFQQNQSVLGASLERLMSTAEAYPDLNADQDFQALQNQLEGAENRISVARGDYVETVRRYNTELRTIPGRWWHRLMYSGMRPKENFSERIVDTP